MSGRLVAAMRMTPVRVSAPEVPAPARLRYGWAAAAASSLRGTESGLPVAQFQLAVP